MRLVVLAAATLISAQAAVRLPALISDHMLVQQQMPVRIWGWAEPGEVITVGQAKQKNTAQTDSSGKWQTFLTPMKAGEHFDLTIASPANSLTVKDVLVGEVWVGSGQSNMEFGMSHVNNADKEIAGANFPEIRLFTVKRLVSETPKDDVEGSWSLCTPETVKNFSAVAYFFGREIHQKRHIPVGLIHSSWGGTPAESWTEPSALKADINLQNYYSEWDKVLTTYPERKQKYDEQLAAWNAASGKPKPGLPPGPGHPNTPSGLYNAMIAPLTPYTIRGALWYQGESNANAAHAFQYRRLFTTMIESWRQAWGEGPFPFYFVQLANFKANPFWPVLRESQNAALELRGTGMAVAIDVGNPTDIHPTDKQTVGHRLALAALAKTYGEKIVSSGPLYRQMMTTNTSAHLWFDSVGTGLEAKGGKLTGFEISGADQKFVPAEAKIAGDTVVVSSDSVPNPIAVRYAWADNPTVSLYNKEGLPASPFRTDAWK